MLVCADAAMVVNRKIIKANFFISICFTMTKVVGSFCSLLYDIATRFLNGRLVGNRRCASKLLKMLAKMSSVIKTKINGNAQQVATL